MKKNILITGTSKGIGKFLVDDLEKSNKIFGISRTNQDEKGFKHFNIDLTKFEQFDKIINFFEQSTEKLDCIIINAGVAHFGKYSEADSDKYKEIINLNLLSPILLIKDLEKYLNDNAKIIFIGSIISKKFMKYAAVYQASKFGLRGFAGALKNELKGKQVSIINPKIVDTSFHDEAPFEIEINGRETKKEDILDIVKKIISDEDKRFEIDL